MNFKDQHGGGCAPKACTATHAIATPATLVVCKTPRLVPARQSQASGQAAAAWPPKAQTVVQTVSPDDLLGQPGEAEADLRAEAAEIVRTHRLRTGRWPAVMNWKGWELAGAAHATKDGCTLVEGLKREGYLHPYVSLPNSPKRGAPGVKPTVQLTRQQMAERAAAWAQFRGCSVLDACAWLGLKF